MLTDYQTVTKIVEDDLCLSCGVCLPVCPEEAIHIELDKKRGYFVPIINYDKCDYCGIMKNGKCVVVCPGVEVNFAKLSQQLSMGEAKSDILGSFVETLYAYSCDNTIRYNSSSGGLITSLLIFALNEKIIDGAIVLSTEKDNPIQPKAILATTEQEIIKAAGSKYCSAHIGEPLSEINKRDGKFAVVGLPCHIHGVKKWERMSPSIKEKIVLHFGLYCANTNTKFATEYFLKQNNIEPNEVINLKYRGDGWPGKIIVTLKDGSIKKINRGTTSSTLKEKLLFSSAFHYDFQMPRCLTCIDLTAELADISFADPWNKHIMKEEREGLSMIVVRSQIGKILIERAEKDKVINIISADPNEVRISQNLEFKKRAPSRVWIGKMLGLPIPYYKGKTYLKRVWDIFSYSNYFMSYLTIYPKLQSLLPAIRLLRWFKASIRGILKKIFNIK